MSNKELEAQLMKARADFYGWTPGDHDNLEQRFRCHHQSSRPIVHGAICRSRASKPQVFKDECSGCPRWEHWRRLAKKSRKIAY